MQLLKAYLSDIGENEYKRGYDMMSDERKAAVIRYRSEKDKKRTILGELLARKGISIACGTPEQEIRFARTENGKPYALNADVYFSISHSKDIVVCAVSCSEIGVDAELIRDIDLRITKFACTDADMLYVFGENPSEDIDKEATDRFFRLWTAKEAYIKYCGTGISCLKHIDFKDIENNCTFIREGDYMIAIYQNGGKNVL